jgi:hypothetical protein
MKYDDHISERTPEEYEARRRHHVDILAQRAKREGNLSQDKLYRGERGMIDRAYNRQKRCILGSSIDHLK